MNLLLECTKIATVYEKQSCIASEASSFREYKNDKSS